MLKTISHSKLLRVLNYTPETGLFYWKINASIGDFARAA